MSELQILGTKKCKDTRLAERFFKERGIHKFHSVDLNEKPLARGELENILRTIPASELINTNAKEYETLGLKYLQFKPEDKLMETPALLICETNPNFSSEGNALVTAYISTAKSTAFCQTLSSLKLCTVRG